MRSLVIIAMVLSVGGAGCGGCVDEDAKPKRGQQQQLDPSRVHRQRAAAPFLSNLVEAGATTTGSEP